MHKMFVNVNTGEVIREDEAVIITVWHDGTTHSDTLTEYVDARVKDAIELERAMAEAPTYEFAPDCQCEKCDGRHDCQDCAPLCEWGAGDCGWPAKAVGEAGMRLCLEHAQEYQEQLAAFRKAMEGGVDCE